MVITIEPGKILVRRQGVAQSDNIVRHLRSSYCQLP